MSDTRVVGNQQSCVFYHQARILGVRLFIALNDEWTPFGGKKADFVENCDQIVILVLGLIKIHFKIGSTLFTFKHILKYHLYRVLILDSNLSKHYY